MATNRKITICIIVSVIFYIVLLIPTGITLDKGSILIPQRIPLGLFLFAVLYSTLNYFGAISISIIILLIPIAITIYLRNKEIAYNSSKIL
jgi:hypothetical protein